MYELPSFIKKILDAVGINSSRVQWKYHYFREGLSEKKNPFGGRLHWLTRKDKSCHRCGTLVSADESKCPSCGARVSSHLVYLIRRTFGYAGLSFRVGVTQTFLVAIAIMYFITKMNYWNITANMEGGIGHAYAWVNVLIKWGGLNNTAFNEGQWWRIFTLALVHGGLMHILFNGWALFQISPIIEKEIGGARTLILITVTQVTAALSALFWGSGIGSVMIGASGFLFGLLGFGISYYWKKTDFASRYYFKVFSQWGIYALLFGLLLGSAMNIANSAHIGGGLGGLALGAVMRALPSTYHSKAMRALWLAGAGICAIIWVASVVLMIMSQKGVAF